MRDPIARGIVVAVDGSPSSTAAVEWAARDAELHNVPLRVVHVIAPLTYVAEGWSAFPTEVYSQAQEKESTRILEQAHKVAVEAAAPDRASQVTSEVLHEPIVPGLVDLSKTAGLVVVGCRGEGGVSGALLGSVSSGLVHHAHCPVAVIHDEDPTAQPSEAPVVVGIDGSPTSELATEIAFDEASRRGVELVALHAWTDMGPLEFPRTNWAPIEWRNYKEQEEEVLSERLSGYRDRYPDVAVRKVVVSDRPAPRLLEQAEHAQLVVVGSHGRGGFTGMLLGSVARAVVHSARVPVIVARKPDHR
ncbi:universal stress protein [Mycolicibacterium hippocampi]|uniref:universal stress protein n=1 Tax=Mycolicibacterium hippocampi TaxID=659824 RepID=UPI0035133856